jgi:hypothetical protein
MFNNVEQQIGQVTDCENGRLRAANDLRKTQRVRLITRRAPPNDTSRRARLHESPAATRRSALGVRAAECGSLPPPRGYPHSTHQNRSSAVLDGHEWSGRAARNLCEIRIHGVSSVSGRAKRTSDGRVKTGHLRRPRFAARPSATRGWLQEARHGEPAQDGQGPFHTGVTRPRLVTAADCPLTCPRSWYHFQC